MLGKFKRNENRSVAANIALWFSVAKRSFGAHFCERLWSTSRALSLDIEPTLSVSSLSVCVCVCA